MLTTDYGDETVFENHSGSRRFVVSCHGIYQREMESRRERRLLYPYVDGLRPPSWVAPDNWASMTRSRSKINTFYGQAEAEYSPGGKWFFTLERIRVPASLVQRRQEHHPHSGWQQSRRPGYDKACVELRFCIGQMAACRAVGLCRWSCARRCRANRSARPGILH